MTKKIITLILTLLILSGLVLSQPRHSQGQIASGVSTTRE